MLHLHSSVPYATDHYILKYVFAGWKYIFFGNSTIFLNAGSIYFFAIAQFSRDLTILFDKKSYIYFEDYFTDIFIVYKQNLMKLTTSTYKNVAICYVMYLCSVTVCFYSAFSTVLL